MLNAAQIAQYRADGYTVARAVVGPEGIEQLRLACDELCEKARDLVEDTFFGVTFFNIMRLANPFAKNAATAPVVPGVVRRVTYPYALSATLNRYRAYPRLIEAVGRLLGPDIKQIVNQVNFNPPMVGQGWGWHQDYRFRKQGIADVTSNFVQTIIAIDPCNTHTGGLRLVPRSFELGDLKLDADNENAERYFDATLAVTPELSPGDVVLFNSHVIHGSTANCSPNPRRVYINGFVRASACPSHGMWVCQRGIPTSEVLGKMEYEGDTKTLPLASKY
jgi:hypothetical protein